MILSTEPEPSSDDELDTEDGEVNTPGSARTQRARDGRTEATRNPPLSAPPAFASTSTNAIVGDNSRSQMKRKDFESLFTSKKRVRYQAAHSDQDDAMRFDAYKRTESKTVPVSDPGRSMESASSVGKKIVDKAKAPPKRRRMPSGMNGSILFFLHLRSQFW